MSEGIDNIIIEHLRHIRGRVDLIAEEIVEVKHRLAGLEMSMAGVKRDVAAGDETDVRQQLAIDRLAARVERIEKRLELIGR